MFLKLYFTTFSVFIAIDMLWLGIIAKNFYTKQIGFLMKTNINWISAIIFYLIFIFGLVIFVINPSLEKNSLRQVILLGALFGLITYGTYDLTNLATIKNWPIIITIIDLFWGMFLATITSLISFIVAKKIGL